MVGAETYTPGETEFRMPIDKLAGTFYADARAREVESMAKEREVQNIHKRNRKTDKFFALTPLVDFDAVFIPDDPKSAGQILPMFAFRDIEKVRFLGTSAWNSSEFISRVGAYGEHAVFMDAFLPESPDVRTRKFVDRFKVYAGSEPTTMEAIAYDAAAVVETALDKASASASRVDVKELLKAVRSFPGVTGRISYRDGQFYRELKALRVKAGRMIEMD